MKACAICTKRHETGNANAPLQCRALPPVQGLARDAVFPTVAADAYCHTYFERDEKAAKALADEAAESERLERLKAETRERAALEAVVAPIVGEDGQPLNPPAGDLAADLAAPNEIREAEAAPPKRARRARSGDEPSLL